MANFKVNDSMIQTRYGKPIRKGTVVKGPFRVDGVDHYHVKWNWFDKGYEPFGRQFGDGTDLVADVPSNKYRLL